MPENSLSQIKTLKNDVNLPTTGELTPAAVPGLVYGLTSLMRLGEDQFSNLLSGISSNPIEYKDLSRYKKLAINPQFLVTVLLYSPHFYLELVRKDKCQFYAVLENNLFRVPQGSINNIVIDGITNSGEKESALLSKEDFIHYIYDKECMANKEVAPLFTLQNFSKTVKKTKLPVPKNQQDCENILKQWSENPYIAYICKYSDVYSRAKKITSRIKSLRRRGIDSDPASDERGLINLAAKLRSEFTLFQHTYINSLCQNMGQTEKFCSRYLSDNYWDKIINGEAPLDHIKYRCEALRGTDQITKDDYDLCRLQFKGQPNLCHSIMSKPFPALYPAPNCDQISFALRNARLDFKYQDCPGKINNEGIINMVRLIGHKEGGLKTNSNINNCATLATAEFTKVLFENDRKQLWNFQVCYEDKGELKKICFPMMNGNFEDHPLNESMVYGEVIQAMRKREGSLECKLVSIDDFKPQYLKFKGGCFLVYEPENCNAMSCPKTVYLDQKVYKGLEVSTGVQFEYFPIKVKDREFSVTRIFERALDWKTDHIKNVSELKNIFKKNKKAILHGIVCAEDLLPGYFKKLGMNNCRPLPIIIDGHIEKDLRSYLIVRTSIDDISTPRIIFWSHVFGALKSYQELHPLKLWGLYVLK